MKFSNYRNKINLMLEHSNMGNIDGRVVGYSDSIPFNVGDLQTLSKIVEISEQNSIVGEMVIIGDINDPYINKLSSELTKSMPRTKISVFPSVMEHLMNFNHSNKYPSVVVSGSKMVVESKDIVSRVFGDKQVEFITSSSDVFNKVCKNAIVENDVTAFRACLTEYDNCEYSELFEALKERANG